MTFRRTTTDEIDPDLHEFIVAADLGREPEAAELFHYTSAAGLTGIVQVKALFATHSDFLNDTTEIQFGLDIVREEVRRFRENGVADEVCNHLEQTFDGRGPYHCFVACFCEADDLVPQWRGYAANGAGYALGFSVEKLITQPSGTLLVGVNYGDTAVRMPVRRVIQLCLDKLRAADRKPDSDRAKQGRDALTSAMVALLLRAIAAKSDVFQYEREFRLVRLIKRSEASASRDILFRPAGNLVVPYMLAPLPAINGTLELASIRCGPTLNSDSALGGVRMLLEAQGIRDVPIRKSVAPLRLT